MTIGVKPIRMPVLSGPSDAIDLCRKYSGRISDISPRTAVSRRTAGVIEANWRSTITYINGINHSNQVLAANICDEVSPPVCRSLESRRMANMARPTDNVETQNTT